MSGGRMRMPERVCLLAQCGEPVGVAECQAHAGGKEHFGVVRLQPGGLVGEQRVGAAWHLLKP